MLVSWYSRDDVCVCVCRVPVFESGIHRRGLPCTRRQQALIHWMATSYPRHRMSIRDRRHRIELLDILASLRLYKVQDKVVVKEYARKDSRHLRDESSRRAIDRETRDEGRLRRKVTSRRSCVSRRFQEQGRHREERECGWVGRRYLSSRDVLLWCPLRRYFPIARCDWLVG